MSNHWRMGMAALLLLSKAACAEGPVQTLDLKENVQARLAAARRHEGRGGWLMAKFETQDEARTEITIIFPAHSFTTHERTLKEIIEGTLDERQDEAGWRKVKPGTEVVFSLPKKGAGAEGGGMGRKSLDHCYLFSLKLAKVK